MIARRLAALTAGLVVLTACADDGATTDSSRDAPAATALDESSADAEQETGSQMTTAVEIKDFTYVPRDITVEVGQTVTWTNQDKFAHTVTAGTPGDPGQWEGELGQRDSFDAQGTTFERTFSETGTYQYYCRFHPNMRGTVTVSAEGS